jgi:hypothetical protein
MVHLSLQLLFETFFVPISIERATLETRAKAQADLPLNCFLLFVKQVRNV